MLVNNKVLLCLFSKNIAISLSQSPKLLKQATLKLHFKQFLLHAPILTFLQLCIKSNNFGLKGPKVPMQISQKNIKVPSRSSPRKSYIRSQVCTSCYGIKAIEILTSHQTYLLFCRRFHCLDLGKYSNLI